MDVVATLVVVTLGAAVLALWVDVRFAERAPRSPQTVVLHGAAAWAVVGALTALGGMLVDPAASGRTTAVLVAVVLPGWTYGYLAMLWALKMVARALPR